MNQKSVLDLCLVFALVCLTQSVPLPSEENAPAKRCFGYGSNNMNTNSGSQGVGGCIDRDKDCQYWAGIGECEKNPVWMNANCKKSCKQCCIDRDKDCQYWAGIGECEKNPVWMNANCKKSCKQC